MAPIQLKVHGATLHGERREIRYEDIAETERERLERDPGIQAWERLPELAMPVTVACGLLDVPAVISEGRAIAERVGRRVLASSA